MPETTRPVDDITAAHIKATFSDKTKSPATSGATASHQAPGHITRSLIFTDEPQAIKSKLSLSRPQTHRLPPVVIWSITLSIPVVVAVVNYMIVITEHFLNHWKFHWTEEFIRSDGVFVGACVLALCSSVMAGVATCLVTFIAPICAGSGVPEAKGYLNGNTIPGLFRRPCLLVRILGITLACAAGFPMGREGPMICIGGTIGVMIVDVIARPFVRGWVNVHTAGEEEGEINPAMIIDEERFAHAKRIGCALGGASGIAAAFNAPIGGILYMFEEVTVTSWPPELTFRTFVCTVLAAFLTKGFLNTTHDDVHHLVIFDDSKTVGNDSWYWRDVPFFLVLSVFLGYFSAGFTRVYLKVWSARDKFKRSPFLKHWKGRIKAAEVVLFAVVCALCFALVPCFVECVIDPSHRFNVVVSDDGGHALRYVEHDCPEGQHREAATLMMAGAEEAVKHLFSRHSASVMRMGPLALCAFMYTMLACGMPGLPIPMGSFVPCLLIGALWGRFVGEAGRETGWQLAHPGVYSLIGAAAMLSGFTHMTIAIVVLLVEAAADLSLVSPIMMGISVAMLASRSINHHAYDEVLILRKGVPFLDAEVPHEMDNDGSTASDLCDCYPEECLLPTLADAGMVMRALDHDCGGKFMDFPIVVKGRCIGLTTRSRLEATVAALRRGSRVSLGSAASEHDTRMNGALSIRHLHEEDKVLGITRFVSGLAQLPEIPSRPEQTGSTASSKSTVGFEESGSAQTAQEGALARDKEWRSHITSVMVPVHRIMDRSPYTILEDMPAPRFYPLFIKAGVSAAAVVSKTGEFVGVLTRGNLISQTRDAHLPLPMRKNSADVPSPKNSESSVTSKSFSTIDEDRRDDVIDELEQKLSASDKLIKELQAEVEEHRTNAKIVAI